MEKEDHRGISSWGPSKEAKKYRENLQSMISEGKVRDAVATDIWEVKNVTGSKYNTALQEMLKYGKKEGIIPLKVRNRRCLMKDYLEEWKKELFYAFDIAMHGHDDDALCKEYVRKYLDLIDDVMRNPSLVHQVRTLFRLFNNEPDYGILEGCYRVLTNIDDEIFIRAFIDELVTVYCNAPTWCAEFFERAIDQEIFFEYVIGLDADKRSILIKLIKDTKEENSQLSDKCDRLLLLIDAK